MIRCCLWPCVIRWCVQGVPRGRAERRDGAAAVVAAVRARAAAARAAPRCVLLRLAPSGQPAEA